ncbi:Paired amphipathic helix protein Sin3b [Mortierella sp. AD031]|nr:Paired amphipathic helix protein Sin3b [Mortierella sp. AD031]KAG0210146.1 Paired amphipathic helix protein Sin3b [Mortierella sp. NVP41]
MSAPRDSSKDQDDASAAASFARSLAGTPLDAAANAITLALSGSNSRGPNTTTAHHSAVPSTVHNIDMLMSDITNAVQSNIASMDQQSQQQQLQQQQQGLPDARMAIAQQLVSLSQNNSRGNDLQLHGTSSSTILSAAAAGISPTTQDTPMYKNAVDYVSSVKKAYENNPQVYKDFMTVLDSYNSLIIPAEELVRTVMTLFQDQPDLLLGFKEFIPETQEVLNHLVPPMMYSDYKAPAAQIPEPATVAPPEAADFLSLIKERSQQEPDMYQHLITLLRNFKKDSSYSNLYFYVSIILRYHPHLLQRFHKFLPAVIADAEVTEPRIISKAPPEELVVSQDFIEAKEFIQAVKHAAKSDMSMYDRFIFALEKYQRNGWTIDQVYSEVSLIFWNHPDALAGFKNFISSVPTPPQP